MAPGRRAAAQDGRSAIAILDHIGLAQVLRRGQDLFSEGDPADHDFKVVSGAMLTYRLLPDGRRHVHDFHISGEYLGFGNQATHTLAAQALTDCTIVRYRRRTVEELIEQHPSIARNLVAVLSHELTAAQDRMLLLGRKTALERLASFLLQLARRIGGEAAANWTLHLFMTRTDIADHLGLTMETVSRGFNRLRRLGAIALPSPICVILRDPRMLVELEEGGGDPGSRGDPAASPLHRAASDLTHE
jgi:CRP-like cAMP-binding protein